ncbi:SDR family NAD(P)-dependent oxidoreductase [Tsukamurella sp. 8F]|nr:SDR family NAD(P)-dependent oxidoreductase [Tsukamurella sp. 8F]MDF0585468.1 SDR family NAD(P)-dependent oxidoreductase [Tsukamurella sp. 8F]
MKLTGATALVTGASHGIGAGTARRLAARGARVVLVARGESALEGVAEQVRERGAQAYVAPCDLGDVEQVRSMERRVSERWGTPDVIVNCAGAGRFLFVDETSMEEFASQIEAPYLAACFTTRAFVGRMISRGTGWIVNVNSPASRVVWPGAVGYAGARWALRGFSDALRADLAGTGVGVTEAVIGKVASNYWNANPGAQERVPSIGDVASALSPDQAGAVVIRGVERETPVVAAPWSARLLQLQARFAPRAAAAVMARTGAKRAAAAEEGGACSI